MLVAADIARRARLAAGRGPRRAGGAHRADGPAAGGRRPVRRARCSRRWRTTRRSSPASCTSCCRRRIGDVRGRDRRHAGRDRRRRCSDRAATADARTRRQSMPCSFSFASSDLVADLQQLRGAPLVAARLAQRLLDLEPLDLARRRGAAPRRACPTDRSCAHGDGAFSSVSGCGERQVQVARQDRVAVGQDDRALDAVLQLAHVARPADRPAAARAPPATAPAASSSDRGRTARRSSAPAAGCRRAARAAAGSVIGNTDRRK